MLDLVIRNGQVVDGTGAPRRSADVAIAGGRVVSIGVVDDSSLRTIDADGAVVAPGFVDAHTHVDAQLFWDSGVTPSCLHGVTTVIAGNCGFSIAPLDEASADFLMRTLARVEGMPLDVLATAVPWDWRTTGEFLDRADAALGINAGFMVGHTALRRVVMGEAASEREATPEEIDSMQALLRRGLQAGGIGFSSSTSESHFDADGRPVPSRFASHAELVALASVCAELPGTSLELDPTLGLPGPVELGLMAQMSSAARRPINWNVLHPRSANVDAQQATLDATRGLVEQGGRIIALTMPLTMSLRYTFLSEFAFSIIPGWGEVMALPVPERIRAFTDPERRRELGRLAESARDEVANAKWEHLTVTQVFEPAHRRYEGRTVGDIAAEQGRAPFDALMDLVCAEDLRTVLGRAEATAAGDWAARRQIWEDPLTMIGGSDAGAHLDLFAMSNFGTRILREAVREQELMTIEQAVHELADVPARFFGLRDKGRLVEGASADVVIFDEHDVGSDPIEMRYDLPTGGGRLYAAAQGISRVIVAGEEVVVEGEPTGARPGRALRSGVDTETATA